MEETLQLLPGSFAWLSHFVVAMLLGFILFITVYRLFNRSSASVAEGLHPINFNFARRIAILIASKDGEKTIGDTVRAAKRTRRNVFVVSDGSTDKTAQVAKQTGANVLTLRKNIGKPSALHRAYKRFELSKRYDAVAILDDDVTIERDFIKEAQKELRDSVIISVGKNLTDWPAGKRWNIWLATRAYSYWCYQLTIRRLQSVFNVMNCISGSNSVYRTQLLDKVLRKRTPYIVDDTYWTLEAHEHRLGAIKYAPKAKAWIQDPTNFKDWYKQNLRWMWGTFQGVIGHKIGTKFNRFHLSYVALLAEWTLYILGAPLLIFLVFSAGVENIPRQLLILNIGYAIWVLGAVLALRLPRLFLFTPVIIITDLLFRVIMVHAFVKANNQRTVDSCVWDSPKRFIRS